MNGLKLYNSVLGMGIMEANKTEGIDEELDVIFDITVDEFVNNLCELVYSYDAEIAKTAKIRKMKLKDIFEMMIESGSEDTFREKLEELCKEEQP